MRITTKAATSAKPVQTLTRLGHWSYVEVNVVDVELNTMGSSLSATAQDIISKDMDIGDVVQELRQFRRRELPDGTAGYPSGKNDPAD